MLLVCAKVTAYYCCQLKKQLSWGQAAQLTALGPSAAPSPGHGHRGPKQGGEVGTFCPLLSCSSDHSVPRGSGLLANRLRLPTKH